MEFMAFDVAYASKSSTMPVEQRAYLGYQDAMRLCHDVGMFVSKPLLTGTQSQCDQFNPQFVSKVSAALGLPSTPVGMCYLYSSWALLGTSLQRLMLLRC